MRGDGGMVPGVIVRTDAADPPSFRTGAREAGPAGDFGTKNVPLVNVRTCCCSYMNNFTCFIFALNYTVLVFIDNKHIIINNRNTPPNTPLNKPVINRSIRRLIHVIHRLINRLINRLIHVTQRIMYAASPADPQGRPE